MARARPLIRVEKLNVFVREVNKLGPEYGKALIRVNHEAGEVVARDARARYAQSRFTSRSGRAVRTIKSLKRKRGVYVKIGTEKRAPYVVGQEWGSDRLKRFAPRVKGGRFFWPAVVEGREKLREEYMELLDRVARGAFPR